MYFLDLKPFQCDECDRAFTSKQILRFHVDRDHRSKSFFTQFCIQRKIFVNAERASFCHAVKFFNLRDLQWGNKLKQREFGIF